MLRRQIEAGRNQPELEDGKLQTIIGTSYLAWHNYITQGAGTMRGMTGRYALRKNKVLSVNETF